MKIIKYKIAKFISIIWPIGYFPFAQGTVASLLAATFGFFINLYFGSDVTFLFSIIFGVAGIWSINIYIRSISSKDPSEVTIDEFSGQLIATSFAGISLQLNVLAFLLFRFFDILKPGIIKKSENLHGSLGVMMDDWIAGIFSALIILFFSLNFSTDYNWFLI